MVYQLDDGSGDDVKINGPLITADATTQTASTIGAAVATTAATSTSPFGYAEAQANDIVSLINQLRVAVVKHEAALVSLGLIE